VEAVPATVTEVASAPGGARPTYPVVVTLDRPVERLRSGMTARVAFTPDDASGLVVPAEAVAQGAGRRFVYVVTPSAADSLDADGRVERRTVATGDLLSSGLVITSGLQAGDRVVTAGLTKIQDGDPVRISRLLSEN
jgi:RND family efflux transporter MFP subunit